MDRDANGRFDDAFEVRERIGAGGLGTVHACRARGNVNAKIPRGMPLVVKTARVRLDAGGCVRANVPTSGRVDAEIRALRRLDACAERDSNAASAMFPSLVAAFSGRHVEKRSPEDAARNVTSSAARVVMTNPVGASSCDLLRLRAEARERRGDENAQFPESEARFYAAQIVVALRYLHARARLAHGDVKPENVLVRRGTGAVALCDFDLARSLTEVSPASSASSALRSADRTPTTSSRRRAPRLSARIVGTPEYVAPEAARGAVAGATAQTDWYQLGVFAFELVFGTTPFAAPFGVVGMTLRAVEANDLRFFDALFAAAATTTSGVSENPENRNENENENFDEKKRHARRRFRFCVSLARSWRATPNRGSGTRTCVEPSFSRVSTGRRWNAGSAADRGPRGPSARRARGLDPFFERRK
jgi:serine/threonine protein kinase